jgi:hypothetical protein
MARGGSRQTRGADHPGPPPMNFPTRRCFELPAAPIVSAILIAGRSRRRGRRRRSRSRLLVCRSGNAHRNGSDSQCKNECNFAHHHTLPLLLRVGYMADLQSSVCDISATTLCFHQAWHARFLPLSRRSPHNASSAIWGALRIRCRPSACTMTAPAGHPESHRP